MKKSIKVDQKKRRGRPATGRGTMVSSRLPPPVVKAIDDWASTNETTRSDAIRRLVELGLTVKMAAKQPSSLKAARAKELAIKAIEKIIDPTAPSEERGQRRRRLTKGPPEFREARVDLPNKK